MGWGEAETKRPRRRDTARASLGGDTQTERAGGKPGSGREMGERRPQWTTTHSPPLHPARLNSYLAQPWGRGASIQGSE